MQMSHERLFFYASFRNRHNRRQRAIKIKISLNSLNCFILVTSLSSVRFVRSPFRVLMTLLCQKMSNKKERSTILSLSHSSKCIVTNFTDYNNLFRLFLFYNSAQWLITTQTAKRMRMTPPTILAISYFPLRKRMICLPRNKPINEMTNVKHKIMLT